MSNKVVKALVYGQEIELKWSDELQGYAWEINAPVDSSYQHNAEHYFPVTITATDLAGNTTTISDTKGDFKESLKLYVYETVKPTIHEVSPSNDTAINTSTPTFKFDVLDNAGSQASGYSGIDPDNISMMIKGKAIGSSSIKKEPIEGGYRCTYTSEDALADGDCTFTITVFDYDGNSATSTYTFKVDTTPPNLYIGTPNEAVSYANTEQITVAGTTADATSGAVQVRIFVSDDEKVLDGDAESYGTDQGEVTVDESGNFSKIVSLCRNGYNYITVLATDRAGKQSKVQRTVILKTDGPVFKKVELKPNRVEHGHLYTIFVQFEDDEV